MYDYGFRIFNPRLAKFLSEDPLTKGYPMLSPYHYAHNNPVMFIDLDGLEGVVPETMSNTAVLSFTNVGEIYMITHRYHDSRNQLRIININWNSSGINKYGYGVFRPGNANSAAAIGVYLDFNRNDP
jgi:hypothetical protein